MLRRHSHPFITAVVVLDALLCVAAFGLACALRFFTPIFGPHHAVLEHYWLALPVLVPASLAGFALARLYEPEAGSSGPIEGFVPCLRGAALAALTVLALSAVYRQASYSRWVLALYFSFVAAGLPLTRALALRGLAFVRRRGRGLHPVLIVGEGPLARELIEGLRRRPWAAIDVIGTVGLAGEGRATDDLCESLGEIPDLERIVEQHAPAEVFVALGWDRAAELPAIERALRTDSADLHVVLDPKGLLPIRPHAGMIDELPVLTIRGGPGYGWNRVLKRALDLVGAGMGLLLFAPLLALLAALVKLGSPGPALYRQVRVGWGGRPFTMLKLRTMRLDAETAGAQFTEKDDPRVTRLGRFLRRTSLDELPQLWNVLRGDMSLVGPRPERPEHLERIQDLVPHYPLRLSVKAGLTGWAQINGSRQDLEFDERVQLDLHYVRNWSIALDLEIILRTALGGFLRDAR